MQDIDIKLIEAAKVGDLELVKNYIEGGANIHALDDFALRWADENGHFPVVKCLKSQMEQEK